MDNQKEKINSDAGLAPEGVFPFRKVCPLRCGPEALPCLFPRSVDEVQEAALRAREARRGPLVPLGGCSNILMSTTWGRGRMFVCLSAMDRIEVEGPLVRVQAGAALGRLVSATLPFSEALAPLAGIPGAVGGALAGNAGAWGTSIGAWVVQAGCVDPDGRRLVLSKEEMAFSYRRSALGRRPGLVATDALLRLPPGDPVRARALAREAVARRRRRGLGSAPSLGSFFRNPPGVPAGALIEGAGLRGLEMGGARVSPLHGNIITNPLSKAEPEEVFALAEHCRKTVKELYGIDLEYEVVLYGFASV